MTIKEWLVKNRYTKLKFTGYRRGGWLVFEGNTNDSESLKLHIGNYSSDIDCGETHELSFLVLNMEEII